jgi:amino acid transporter
MTTATSRHPVPHSKLGQLAATAICGNDITSSCLYVSALAIVYSGRWAPLALLIVAAVLYLFRSIYAEVVGALPLNGGAYNALLNTSSKFRASIAACLTILSYMATAVLSASEAMHYAHGLVHSLPVLPATIALLGFFMVLSIIGITESSAVAIGIFVIHLGSLGLLLAFGGVHVFRFGFDTLITNLSTPTPDGPLLAIFFGFSAAMLGISGFESSANFVEEQAPGVFPKTLRNMWIAVTAINPSMALLALALLPMAAVAGHQESLLAHMGDQVGGRWLAGLISVDATLVLSGAVLTSFVGVTGLIRRMALDRVLPQFLLAQSSRGTSHRVIIAFFALCTSITVLTAGELKTLAGVYTISFLAVMALFGIGNLLLKLKRDQLPRPTRASLPTVLLAILAVLVGLVGNALLNPAYLGVFLEYFIPSMLIVAVMLGRISLLKAALFVVQAASEAVQSYAGKTTASIIAWMARVNSQQIVFFTRGDNLANLNQAVLYVRENEHTNLLKVVTVGRDKSLVPERLASDLAMLDEAYPEIRIEYIFVDGEFGPALIDTLSARWQVPPNFMFIGSPGHGFPRGLAELGGVRLIV